MGDLDATAAYAKVSGKADVSRLGVTGFCWGGRMVWMYTGHNPNVKAAVAWYLGSLAFYRRDYASAEKIPERSARDRTRSCDGKAGPCARIDA